MFQKYLWVHLICFTLSLQVIQSNTDTTTIESTTEDLTTTSSSSSDVPTTIESTTEDLTTTSSSSSDVPTTIESTSEKLTTTTTSSSSDAPTTTTSTTTTTEGPHFITTSYTWTPSDLAKSPHIIIQTEKGNSISVTISNVELADNSYILIQGGDHQDTAASDGRVLAKNVKGPLKYLFLTTSVFAICKLKTESEIPKFNIVFEIIETETTTPIPTTSTDTSWPTTDEGDVTDITVNIGGKILEAYKKSTIVEAFQNCVVDMAKSYCSTENIELTEMITTHNVVIDQISSCPSTWPQSETCVQIRFKLPIYYNSLIWSGYQLNRNHLEIMWSRLAYNNKCFYDSGFTVVDEPDFNNVIFWWCLGIAIVIIAFVILLWFLRTCSLRYKRALYRRRRDSDTTSIISSKIESRNSLTPHYLQDHVDTPKFFDN